MGVAGQVYGAFGSEMMTEVWMSEDADALQRYESLPAELQLRSYLGLVNPTPTPAGYLFCVTPDQTVCEAHSRRFSWARNRLARRWLMQGGRLGASAWRQTTPALGRALLRA